MMGLSHYTNFQSSLEEQDKILAFRYLFYLHMAQNVVLKLNFRIWNNPPCFKKSQKFCLIFFRKLTSRATDVDSWKIARSTRTFSLQLPEWITLSVIFGAFLKLSWKRLSFSKLLWNNLQEIWPSLNEIGSSKPSYSKAGSMKCF